MNTSNFILNRINTYFQKISLDWHRNFISDDCCEYVPTPLDFICEKLNLIEKNDILFQNKKFLDVGSGIGNICGVATYFGLIAEGIELNPVLCEISKQLYPEVKIHNIDIRDFDKYENYDIIFYYVPFANFELENQLVRKIEDSIKIGSYIIVNDARGVMRDDRFISIDGDEFKNQVWQKIK